MIETETETDGVQALALAPLEEVEEGAEGGRVAVAVVVVAAVAAVIEVAAAAVDLTSLVLDRGRPGRVAPLLLLQAILRWRGFTQTG